MWNSKISCPEWVFYPHKPYPFGNKCHTMWCVESSIAHGIKLVKKKDRPNDLDKQIEDEIGLTVGLLMQLTKLLHATGKVVT